MEIGTEGNKDNQCKSRIYNFGIRDGEIFTCPHCGNKMDADVNAAHNIMKRKEIEGINIYTSASKVKEHYLKLNN